MPHNTTALSPSGPSHRALAATQAAGDLPAGMADRVISLFGLDVTDTTLERAAAWTIQRAVHMIPTTISFLNADCVNIMHRNQVYLSALTRSDRIFADGIGVRLAVRLAGQTLQDNVNGTDLLPVLCREAANASVGLYLFGAKPGRAELTARNMQQSNPGLIVSGFHHGYISPDAERAMIEAINASGAGVLLVALGAPAQELWIARNRHRLNPSVIVGVGGLFDYYSGSVPRAPLPIRKVHMEWAWRLAMEPRRLARRYIIGNVEFLVRAGLLFLRAALGRRLPERSPPSA